MQAGFTEREACIMRKFNRKQNYNNVISNQRLLDKKGWRDSMEWIDVNKWVEVKEWRLMEHSDRYVKGSIAQNKELQSQIRLQCFDETINKNNPLLEIKFKVDDLFQSEDDFEKMKFKSSDVYALVLRFLWDYSTYDVETLTRMDGLKKDGYALYCETVFHFSEKLSYMSRYEKYHRECSRADKGIGFYEYKFNTAHKLLEGEKTLSNESIISVHCRDTYASDLDSRYKIEDLLSCRDSEKKEWDIVKNFVMLRRSVEMRPSKQGCEIQLYDVSGVIFELPDKDIAQEVAMLKNWKKEDFVILRQNHARRILVGCYKEKNMESYMRVKIPEPGKLVF
jgi:hypothetical protein